MHKQLFVVALAACVVTAFAHDEPGKSGVIVWQFTKPGEFFYACLVEDHFELGMYGKIRVTGAPTSADGEHSHGGHASAGHAQPDEMQGMYGPYAMARESSG